MPPSPRRSYRQFCALAQALDLLGERWTLLIVRDLLYGPRRYTDLLAGLPGIGTNLLSARLKELEAAGLVTRRELPRPAPATVYELTDRGRGLEAAILALASWHMEEMPPPRGDEEMRPSWYLVAMRSAFRPEHSARAEGESCEFSVGGEIFHLGVTGGEPQAAMGPARAPAATLETDLPTFLGVVTGSVAPREAVAQGSAKVSGDRRALERCLKVFHLPRPLQDEPTRRSRAI